MAVKPESGDFHFAEDENAKESAGSGC